MSAKNTNVLEAKPYFLLACFSPVSVYHNCSSAVQQGSGTGPEESQKHVVENERVDSQSEGKQIHQENFSYTNKSV